MGLDKVVLHFTGAGKERRVVVSKRTIERHGGVVETVWVSRIRLPSGRVWGVGGTLRRVVKVVVDKAAQFSLD